MRRWVCGRLEGARSLAAALGGGGNTSLIALHLGKNNIGSDGARALGAALGHNAVLRSLQLEWCKARAPLSGRLPHLPKNPRLPWVPPAWHSSGPGPLISLTRRIDCDRADWLGAGRLK